MIWNFVLSLHYKIASCNCIIQRIEKVLLNLIKCIWHLHASAATNVVFILWKDKTRIHQLAKILLLQLFWSCLTRHFLETNQRLSLDDMIYRILFLWWHDGTVWLNLSDARSNCGHIGGCGNHLTWEHYTVQCHLLSCQCYGHYNILAWHWHNNLQQSPVPKTKNI